MVVADEDELGIGTSHMTQQLGQLATRQHGGLVDDDYATRRHDIEDTRSDVLQQAGDAGRRDPRAVLELARSPTRDRGADYADPGRLPGLAGGAERERLATARL